MAEEKILIFDSSTIINFALNGLLETLIKLRKIFSGKFIITEQVKREVIDIPLRIKKYELEALQIKKLFDEKTFEMPSSIKIQEEDVRAKTKEILNIINHTYYAQEFIHVVDEGEVSCLALSLLAEELGIKSAIAVDERTTRMLGENPENLRKLFESKFHEKIQLRNNFSFLENIKFIRSSELMYLAYKKGLIDLKNGNVLDALLYASKFKGCSVSSQEIEEMKRLGA